MNLKGNLLLTGLLVITVFNQVNAAPFADLDVTSKRTHNGIYTYTLIINNQGPVLIDAATPMNHTIEKDYVTYDAGGKSLNEDENIVVFGIDTGRDDITISNITNGGSAFHGTEETGWADDDYNGIFNQVVAWHLPFDGWEMSDTLGHGESITVTFQADARLDKVLIWVGGSDDNVIWINDHTMLEDKFGIYDYTLGEYLAAFLERHVHVKFQGAYGMRR